jgi:hypothetical protein
VGRAAGRTGLGFDTAASRVALRDEQAGGALADAAVGARDGDGERGRGDEEEQAACWHGREHERERERVAARRDRRGVKKVPDSMPLA